MKSALSAFLLLAPRAASACAYCFGQADGKNGLLNGFWWAVVVLIVVTLSLVGAKSPYLLLAVGLVVLSAGAALAMPTMSTGIVLSLPMSKAGVGSAVNDTTREVGGAVGIAVLGSILSSHYRNGMKTAIAQLPPEAAQVAVAARRGVGALAGLVAAAPGVPALEGRLPQLQALLSTAKTEFTGGMHLDPVLDQQRLA